MTTEEKRLQDNKRYRFYMFHGHRFPGELIGLDPVIQSRLRRPVTLEECPILGDCVLYAVIRIEYNAVHGVTEDNSDKYWRVATNKQIHWSIERGLPISEAKPWKDSVEKEVLNSDKFMSLMGATQDTSKGINHIQIPYYSWVVFPIYVDDPRNYFSVPFVATPLLHGFWEAVTKKTIDKPMIGQWESLFDRVVKRISEKTQDKTGLFNPI